MSILPLGNIVEPYRLNRSMGRMMKIRQGTSCHFYEFCRWQVILKVLVFLLVHGPFVAAQDGGDAPAGSQRPKDGLALAAEVLGVFEAKCIECHGPKVPKPKADFGYILDLQRVAGNPHLVIPGKSEGSLLYELVRDGEMPPKKDDDLTSEQKHAIKRWIDRGAPNQFKDSQPVNAAHSLFPDDGKLLASSRVVTWLGRFHPVAVHFPIALLLAAALAELLGTLTGQSSFEPAARFCLIVGAIGAVVAAPLGWADAVSSSHTGWPLFFHRWLGTATATWALIMLLLVFSRVRNPQGRWRYRIAIYLGAIAVCVTAFLGSAVDHGFGYYFQW